MQRDIVSDIRTIYTEAIRSANGGEAVRRVLKREGCALIFSFPEGSQKRIELGSGRLYIVGAGKATAAMAEAVEEICGDLIFDGVISVKYGHTGLLSRIRQIEASHPVPDENGMTAAKELLSLAGKAGEDDIILSLISGGASALTAFPCEGISLTEKQLTTELLLSCGAPIEDINCVRKHISAIKGGRLACAGFPSRMISLCISDVVGDDISVIGSGLFFPDPSTFSDAYSVLVRHEIIGSVPSRVVDYLIRGINGEVPESPKGQNPIFEKVKNSVCMSNLQMMMSAERKARDLGYDTVLLSSSICGDTTDAAKFHAAKMKDLLAERNNSDRPLCVFSGGETTVRVTGGGKGGRNMEFTLRTAIECEDLNIVIASIGTDGTDGPTDAAGAYLFTSKLKELRMSGLVPERYAKENDSYSFFQSAESLLKTGPTGTNVLDLRMIFSIKM